MSVRYGITLGTLNPKSWLDATVAAEELGFESVWLSDHLVAPVRAEGTLASAKDTLVRPSTPLLDPVVTAAYLAARTTRVRIGSYVYLLGLRHPFISARAWATADVLSHGRVTIGAGAGWLTSEWAAAGVDPATRGARFDEAINVCRRLWTEEIVSHDGPHFPFEPVGFEPKPVQRPIPIHIGGESERALRRAAQLGDGWMGGSHTPSTARTKVRALRDLRAQAQSSTQLEITVLQRANEHVDPSAWEAADVDRVIVTPWANSREAVEAMERFAR